MQAKIFVAGDGCSSQAVALKVKCLSRGASPDGSLQTNLLRLMTLHHGSSGICVCHAVSAHEMASTRLRACAPRSSEGTGDGPSALYSW